MRKILLILVIVLGAYFGYQEAELSGTGALGADPSVAAGAVENWRSGQQVRGEGVVSRVLSDDNEGSRHQRFILRLESGRTLLIAHNIDLAPRIGGLRVGDTVSFYGQYEWNEQGGVIHWTHHDPQGRHADGWLEHRGRRYQ